jgi:aminoglycoside N3'-acetyltransferase
MTSAASVPVPRARLLGQLHALGVEPGGVLVVHTAFRAIRPVEGGPHGLIDVLQEAVGSTGTLVMPSMADTDDEAFDPDRTTCLSMGIVAETFRSLPGVRRSDSPHAFAARGPQAEAITADHPPEVPHGPDSPIGRVHDLDGQVLLLGVDHDANTTVHLGEYLAGVPYWIAKRCTIRREGQVVSIEYGEIDHCCRNFALAGGWLRARGLERQEAVGSGTARLARARDIVSVVVESLRTDPCRFLCPRGSGCEECDLAWESVPPASPGTGSDAP